MSVTPASTILKLGESGFYICGALNPEELSNLKKEGHINSFLYLCPDTAADSGLVSGFSSCDVFPRENSAHAPFDPTDFAFTVSKHTAPFLIFVQFLDICTLFGASLLMTNLLLPHYLALPPSAHRSTSIGAEHCRE